MSVFETVMKEASRKRDGFGGLLDRRSEVRMPWLRASQTGLTSHLWELELVPAKSLDRIMDPLTRLAERSMDHNIFFSPTVLEAAWPRLVNLLAPKGCWMAALWETTGEGREMRLFVPLQIVSQGLPRQRMLKVLSNPFMPLGTPLIDLDCAGEACEMLLRLLGDPELGLPPVINFSHQDEGGDSFALLREAGRSLNLASGEVESFARAAMLARQPLDESATADEMLRAVCGRKRTRESARKRRRFSDDGHELRFSCARDLEDVLDAFEAFMTMELRSWKGRKGTALYNHKKISSFSREIVAKLAMTGSCEIFTLEIDDAPAAALIVLGHGGYYVPWKIAFDERQHAVSPGEQVMMYATGEWLTRPDFIAADSLAVPGHGMAEQLWSDRIGITDWLVALTPDAADELPKTIKALTRVSDIKDKLRPLAQRLGLR